MKPCVLAAVALLAVGSAGAAPTPAPGIAPPPRQDLDDRAHFLSEEAASRLGDRLRAFRTRTRNQVVVSIFGELPSPSFEDFTVRTAQAWRIGQKGLDNGVVLFVFVKDRKLRLEVGYGLEDKIPDAIAKRILDDLMTPLLKAGQNDKAFDVGLEGIFAAIEGRPLPLPGAAGESALDVPIPPSEGVTDDAGLLDPAGRTRIEQALDGFVKDTSCRLALIILRGGPIEHSPYHDADLYATRSFFRANPRAPGQSDDDYFKGLSDAPATGYLFVFVNARSPLDVALAYSGSHKCVREDTVKPILLSLALDPGLASDPPAGLARVLEIFDQVHAGTYVPPSPPPAPPPTVGDRVFAFVNGVGMAGWIILLLILSSVLALPFRSGEIRQRMRDGSGFLPAWGIETLMVFGFIIWTGVETTLSSGGSSRSSSSSGGGGGGSFGGGGASGGW